MASGLVGSCFCIQWGKNTSTAASLRASIYALLGIIQENGFQPMSLISIEKTTTPLFCYGDALKQASFTDVYSRNCAGQ